jgi:hypothetical protein
VGGLRLPHLLVKVIPRLRRKGADDQTIETLWWTRLRLRVGETSGGLSISSATLLARPETFRGARTNVTLHQPVPAIALVPDVIFRRTVS